MGLESTLSAIVICTCMREALIVGRLAKGKVRMTKQSPLEGEHLEVKTQEGGCSPSMASVSMAKAQRRAEISLVPGPCCLLPANRETQEERLTLATDDYKDFLLLKHQRGAVPTLQPQGIVRNRHLRL